MLKRILLPLTALAFALAAPAARAAQWTDDSFHLWYGSAFAEPGVGDFATNEAQNVAKTVLTYTHASGYKYGGNFLNIDFLYSDTKDPVQGLAGVKSAGALEVYAVYRHTLSLSKISGSKVGFGPIRDVGIELGGDVNTKHNAFASRKIMPVGGLSLAFDVPGFLNVGFLADKEWNVNALPGAAKSVTFDVTLMVAAAWFIPVYGPVSFEGFGDVNLPKGKDGFGNDTKVEVLLHPKVMVDVGSLLGSKGWQIGGGFQYWLNKFGNDHDTLPGAYEKAFFAEVAVHL